MLIILFLFLLNFRTTFITLTAIPLSLVITTLVFRLIGFLTGTQLSINVMTLGGIAVAMGELVDDAIVDVENIFRRLKENNASPSPQPALSRSSTRPASRSAAPSSSARSWSSWCSCRCSPCRASKAGCSRRWAIAYIVSILASLLVSLTVTPVLSLLPAAAVEGDAPSPRRRPAAADAQVARDFRDPPQHGRRRLAAAAHLAAGRRRGVAS